MRRVPVTIVVVEKQVCSIFWACFCSLSYPACNAHMPYYIVICRLPGCEYFSTLSYKRRDFRENITEHKMW